MTTEQNISRQITIASINGIRSRFKVPEARLLMMRIVGYVHSADVKALADTGVTYRFSGEFAAYNKDGELTYAPVCFLPPEAQKALHKAAEDGSVQFGFDFYMVPDKDQPAGFYWETVPTLPIERSSALAGLLSLIDAKPEVKVAETENAEQQAKPKRK